MDFLVIGIIASVIGVILIFFQDSIASVGSTVDNLIANQWTPYALVIIGAVLIFLPVFSKTGIKRIEKLV